jgi:hypothetical protein
MNRMDRIELVDSASRSRINPNKEILNILFIRGQFRPPREIRAGATDDLTSRSHITQTRKILNILFIRGRLP